MKIQICIPTRGAIMTETVEAIQAAVAYAVEQDPTLEVGSRWHMSAHRPIPDGHLWCLERAMRRGFDAVWFVEEDVVPLWVTLDRLVKLIKSGADLAFSDYPMQGGEPGKPNCYHRNPRGEVTWTGFGCTLIHRRVFDIVPKPWFRADMVAEWVAKDSPHESIRWKEGKAVYGGFDIWFGWQLYKAGGRLEVIDLMAGHVKLKALGTRETQDGLHTLEYIGGYRQDWYTDGVSAGDKPDTEIEALKY